jgi:glutamate/tyrosine decarboxylase-like PLP-dependent enzyme
MTVPATEVRAALAGRPALLQDASQRALAYLGGLAGRPVAPPAEAVAALDRLDFALPGPGLEATEVLRMLDELGSPATVASAGPRYFGFVTGGTLPVAQAAAWLGAAWDQNAALTVMSPAAARLNAVALRWIAELLALPAGTAGGFVSGAYLPGEAGTEAMHLTPQSSQRARGAELWAALAALGRDGVAGLVDRTCGLARRFAGGMRAAGHEVLNDVVLNQVLVAFGDAPRTDAVIAAVQDDGTCWCGPTTWHGRRAMRVSVSCWNTTEDDIDKSVAAVQACAAR